jgi:hypothetical protein
MEQNIDLTFILAGAGLAFGLVPLGWLMFKANINAAAFGAAIKKLVEASNLDRAIKLCSAAPTVPLAKGTRAVLEAYRDGSRDSVALKESFETAAGAGGLGKAIGRFSWMSYLGLVLSLAAGGALFYYGFVPSAERVGVCVAAFVIGIIGIFKNSGVRGQAERSRDDTIEFLLERALME